ncbi:hypothetical protein M885DRAFT_623320 [Pelagophyceae sp. CCMP2097]|nr:hypothetical protein M885DRAFT_623320 [Pelagophyceae sp. CCMP2097]
MCDVALCTRDAPVDHDPFRRDAVDAPFRRAAVDEAGAFRSPLLRGTARDDDVRTRPAADAFRSPLLRGAARDDDVRARPADADRRASYETKNRAAWFANILAEAKSRGSVRDPLRWHDPPSYDSSDRHYREWCKRRRPPKNADEDETQEFL